MDRLVSFASRTFQAGSYDNTHWSRSKPRRIVTRLLVLLFVTCLVTLCGRQFFLTPDLTPASRNEFNFLRARGSPPECNDVRSAHDQCAFVKRYCKDQDDGIIPYLSIYYCRLPNAKPAAWILTVLWTIFLFTAIGICAGDFFAVNLAAIARALRLSDAFAGVTLLALGNGGPDIFSTWASLNSGSPGLAVGELVGAAFFITTVVAGSIALVGTFEVHKISFLRDATFLMLTAALLIPIIVTERLYLWQGCVMVGLYVIYVSVVAGYHWWRNAHAKAHIATANGGVNDTTSNEQSANDTTPLLFGQAQKDSENATKALFKDMSSWRRTQTRAASMSGPSDYHVRPSIMSTFDYRRRASVSDSTTSEQAVVSWERRPRPTREQSPKPGRARHVFDTLFPTLRSFWNQRSWYTAINLFTTIPFFLMMITIPSVEDEDDDDSDHDNDNDNEDDDDDDDDDEDGDNSKRTTRIAENQDRWLLLVQSLLAPQFVWALLWPDLTAGETLTSWLYPALYCLAGSAVFIAIMLLLKPSINNTACSLLVMFLGFVLSAFWLSKIADEVVSIMQALGVILDISEGILGFTLFAIGNSLDDLVADLTVAQHGHPVMALAACFGGPLLNILLGLGTSLVYVILHDAEHTGTVRPIIFERDWTLVISAAVLTVVLLVLVVVLRIRAWQMTRATGIALVATWVVLAVVNLVVELVVE